MPKGKKGPYPEMTVTSETLGEPIEESFLDEPTAEEIVGAENIVDVGSVRDEDEEEDGDPSDPGPLPEQGYFCSQVGCNFRTSFLTEMEEHVSGTGHGGFKAEPIQAAEPVQPELFSPPPGVIHKWIDVPMDEEFLNEKRTALAALYQKVLDTKAEKKSADAEFNAELAAFDEQMQAIARILQKPMTATNVACEWRIIENENARGLYRLDTGVMIEKKPLSEQDRLAELAKAQAANAQPELPAAEPVAEPVVEPAPEPIAQEASNVAG